MENQTENHEMKRELGLLYYKTSTCGWGLALVLIGIPIYYLSRNDRKS